MPPPAVTRRTLTAVTALALTAGCSSDPRPAPTGRGPAPGQRIPATAAPESAPGTLTAAPALALRPRDFDRRRAMQVVDQLARVIGPRHATSPAYDRASQWVAAELGALGYDARRQRVRTPAGDSWGVPVAAGLSYNVVATLPGLDTAAPHLVVGAHLDTVPQAPGAEDNASGVAVVLAAAAAAAGATTRLPVVFVAFGAEEPRGPTDDDHHYGSRAYVTALSLAERRAVLGMVSLDRVGVGGVVPIGTARSGDDPARDRVVAAARRAGVPYVLDENRSSDHWSFVRAGLPGVRLGSTPYAGYHSAGDTVDVVDPDQVDRTGRLLLAWLSGSR